jgi:hypothetical protein
VSTICGRLAALHAAFAPIAGCTSADARAHALRCAATIFFLLRSLGQSRWFTGTGTAQM